MCIRDRFDIHVNSVQAYDLPELTDEYVQENTDYDSIEDMQASVREELEQDAQTDAEDNWQYSLIKQVLDNSEFEIEDADVKAYTDEMLTEYQTYANMYGMEMEEFLQSQMGVTEEQLREAYRETDVYKRQVLITSNSCSQNCLRQIVTHVQREFAPHFLTDIFRTAEMNSCFRKQLLHRTNSFTFIGHFQLSENNPNSRFRVKAISIPFFMRCHFNQRIQDMGCLLYPSRCV